MTRIDTERRRRGAAGSSGSRSLACAALLLAVPAFCLLPAHPAEAQSAARKFGRGLAAMTTGFLEIPGNIVEEHRERGPVYGFTLGFAKGLGGVVVRELVGVYEFVTAPFPVPEDFQPILSPEFPWGYFEEGSTSGAERPIGERGAASRLLARARAHSECRLPEADQRQANTGCS